jgi:hypothetical protein
MRLRPNAPKIWPVGQGWAGQLLPHARNTAQQVLFLVLYGTMAQRPVHVLVRPSDMRLKPRSERGSGDVEAILLSHRHGDDSLPLPGAS